MPVLRSSSDPPVNSRCLKPEEATTSPSPPLKRQVGLLPVDGGVGEARGDTDAEGWAQSALCTPQIGLIVSSLGRQTQHAVPTLIGRINQICSILKHAIGPSASQRCWLTSCCALGALLFWSVVCFFWYPWNTALSADHLNKLIYKLMKKWQ